MPGSRNAEILTRRPGAHLASNRAFPVIPAGVTASANGTATAIILSAANGVVLDGIRITPVSAISVTDQTTAAVGFINRYRGGVQIGYDGAVGAFPFLKAGAPLQAAFTPLDIASFQGFAWVGYLTAGVTGGVDTGATVAKYGSSSLSGIVESTAILNGGSMSFIVDPGTTVQETIKVSAYNTGTGAFTIAGSGVFANSHVAGALMVLAGPLLWAGTSTAATAGVSTGTTLTAISPSLLTTLIGVGQQLIFEPFTSNAESVPIGTLNTGTGAFTIDASYNGGKFVNGHVNGCTVGIALSQPTYIQKGEVLTFKWVQSATTGLIFPSQTLMEIYTRESGR